ncbi:hypothetical protein [Pandoraea horticolens]|uniref:hypothetical protein n=1 Tax=Pandoraea horticolens TaxID=2508298 RepID=UPI001240C20A|nr:hypothetical protein [Pandoraea horticolens]
MTAVVVHDAVPVEISRDSLVDFAQERQEFLLSMARLAVAYFVIESVDALIQKSETPLARRGAREFTALQASACVRDTPRPTFWLVTAMVPRTSSKIKKICKLNYYLLLLGTFK